MQADLRGEGSVPVSGLRGQLAVRTAPAAPLSGIISVGLIDDRPREGSRAVNVCEAIRQSIDVNVPAEVANQKWTRFTLWNIYYRSLKGPDESEAERDSGFVRMEAIDDHTTRVTVDLNYCPHYEGISDPEEIAQTEQHLRGTLGHYKEFVESQRV
jgi:uncharacterized membrane protein